MKNSLLLQLLPYLYGIRLRLLAALTLVTISVGCSCIIPYLFKIIINSLSAADRNSPLFVAVLLCGYGMGWMVSQLIVQLRTIAIYRMLERSKKLLSVAIVDKLLSLSVRFHTEQQTGKLTDTIDKAQQGLDAIFWGILLFFMPTALQIIVICFIIGSSCGIVHGIVLCAGILAHTYVSYQSLSALTTLQSEHNQASSQVTARLTDVLSNIETVKHFAREEYEKAQMSRLLNTQEMCGIKRWTEDGWFQTKHMLVIGIGIWAITMYTGYAVYASTLPLGTFILINAYLLQCMMPLGNIGYVIHQVRKGFQDMTSIMALLQTTPEIQDPETLNTPTIAKPQLTMQNVSFGYSPERMVLNNISFSVNPGDTVAIVGPSGSGKSTIAKLMLRMYDVSSGNILLNGTDIRTMNQQSLRTVIGIVPQEITLFNTTLYANIAYGDPDASKEEVHRAAERAQLGKFIGSLPQGYETIVGGRGLKLSGGEKQRIAIARVLLENPLLYIFDEVISSLDSNTEQEIQSDMKAISAGMTTIIMTDRLSTITHADTIIVLDQGRIVEQGTHEKLLQKNTLYASLWRKQQRGTTEIIAPRAELHSEQREAPYISMGTKD